MLTQIVNVEEKFEYMYKRNKLVDENFEKMGYVVHKIKDNCQENVSRIKVLEQSSSHE